MRLRLAGVRMMPLLDGSFVSPKTLEQLRQMTDSELIEFRDSNTGWYRGLVDAAELEMQRREESE